MNPSFPLSQAEKRIYLTQRAYPASPMWNILETIEIQGPPQPAMMRRAVELTVARYQNLRLRFTEDREGPKQYDVKDAGPVFETLDLVSSGGENAWREWLDKQCQTPFKFLDAPLHYFAFVSVSQNRSFLFVKCHHIIVDGSAMAEICSTLSDYYFRLLQGEEIPAVAAPDFLSTLALEEEYLNSPQFQSDRNYWEQRFMPPPEAIELSLRQPDDDDLHTETFRITLDRKLEKKFYDYCTATGNSPFRVMLAAFSGYCARISGREEITIGSATAGSHGGRVPREVIGMQVNTVALKVATPLDRSFAETLAAARTSLKEAIFHGSYPYNFLAEHLRRELGEIPPLLDISLVQFIRSRQPAGCRAVFYPATEHSAALTIYFAYDTTGDPDSNPTELMVAYRTSVLSQAEARRHIRHLLVLLQDALDAPDKSLNRLKLLSDEEERVILNSFNDTARNYPTELPLHRGFENRVLEFPDRPAVVYRKRVLSYRELNRMANQLARRLAALGVGPDTIVGLWAERSVEVIVAQLAILKAGGAFMPIDVKYPLERARFMMEDSGAKVLIAHQSLLGEADFGVPVLRLDDAGLFQGDGSNLASGVGEENLAVVIYTSGSTGRPKGTMIEHRAMVNFAFASIELLEITEKDRFGKFASFSFDASNVEIYPALLAGAAVHIIPEEVRLALGRLNHFFEENGITMAFLTTQLGEQFMEFIDNHSLRLLMVGGEKLRIFKQRDYLLLNGYGPTECTVMATAHPVSRFEENIPIGRPIGNYEVLILDAAGNLMPIGVPGELCIRGISLARGYLNRPEKTAEAFVDDPRWGRIYRTHDLAAWREDGTILYLGRMDRQVKLRGYRVELGEIEQALLALPEITEAAVADLKDEGGRLYLCGYYCAAAAIAPEKLRKSLLETIPEFMVPARFLWLEAMPTTPSGKIDRKNLPAPPKPESTGPETFEPPATETEKSLARIWEEILKAGRIGRQDDFFRLGGDSLKCVTLQLDIEREFAVSLPVSALFKNGVLARQATLIAEAAAGSGATKIAGPALPPLTRAPRASCYPLTDSQRQLFILANLGGSGTVYNVPLTIAISGPLDRRRLRRALQALVENYSVFRTSFELRDGVPVQIVHPEVYLKMEAEEVAADQVTAAAKDFVRPFDLRKPPLLRVKLLRTKAQEHLLLLDTHHIISDGFSVSLLLEALSKFYTDPAARGPEFAFVDFAVWREKALQADLFAGMGEYWRQLLKDLPEVEMPTDRERGDEVDFTGRSLEFAVDAEQGRKLAGIASDYASTSHHLLLAALAVLIGRYAEAEDLVIGTTTSGRNLAGSEKIIGMFVNTLPVRLKPAIDKPFGQLLEETGEAVLKTIENDYFPVDGLYDELGLRRGGGRHPLIDINFVSRDTGEHRLILQDATGRVGMVETGTAKFDLSFAVTHAEDGSIAFHLEYRSALYREDTINRLAGHYLQILKEIAKDPARPVGKIGIFHPDEKRFILDTVNATETPPPAWPTVPRAFEARVAAAPGHPAVTAGEITLTYAELNRLANRFAARIRKQSLPPDTIIAVVADRSVYAVVGMLGALKAGVAFVGLDPGYPAERRRFILDDTRAPLLAGRAESLAVFDDFAGEKIALDKLSPQLASGNPELTPAGDALAYVIFTSGSTGTPKGVMIEHHSMVNFIDWYVRRLGLSREDKCAEFAAFSFDVSVVQVFAPLTAGAELVIIPEELRRQPLELNQFYESYGITHTHFPTRFAEQFMRAADNRSLKRMVVGGDALRHYRLGNFELINEYGPSETTMASTAFTVREQLSRVPVGTPIANTRVYILDRYQRLRPIGFPGELYIGGAGVARGYLNRQELTAAKFIPSPFREGERLFKTGDLVRLLPDGNLDFVGRVDFQVKIRGFRVEPGEIDQRLLTHPAVTEAVTIAVEQASGDKALCSYYTAATEISPEELKTFIAEKLPEYMVPAFFVRLEQLPLNRNGKIDRKALPRPELPARARKSSDEPVTELERRILDVWKKVLGFENIGVHDDFFALGGDSLNAIVLALDLQTFLKVRTNDVFTYKTVAEQAAHFEPATGDFSLRLARLKKLPPPPRFTPDAAERRRLKEYERRIEEIRKAPAPKLRPPSRVLLTGATGTLGIYLLRELLQFPGVRITAVVRGEDLTAATARLTEKMHHAFPGFALPEAVTVVTGDLVEPDLGLAPKILAELEKTVDCIIHAAADTRHAGEYETFQRNNVVATENLLALAGRSPLRPRFNYISTVSVAAGRIPDKACALFTEDDLDLGQTTANVYVRSKLAAEKKVAEFRERGGFANVFRLGNITLDSETGIYQPNIESNAFFQQLKSFINLGKVPDRFATRNLTYVDQAAAAVVLLAFLEPPLNRALHIDNPHLADLAELLAAPELKLKLAAVPFEDFVDFLNEHYRHPGFKEFLERLMNHLGWNEILEGIETTTFIRKNDYTLALLEKLGFRWPRPKAAHIEPLVYRALAERREFFARVGLLSGVEPEILENLVRSARMRITESELPLYREDREFHEAVIVADGLVEIHRLSDEGWIGSIRVRGPESVLALSSLKADRHPSVTAEAYDDVLWYGVDNHLLRQAAIDSPALMENLLGLMAEEIDTLSRLIVSYG